MKLRTERLIWIGVGFIVLSTLFYLLEIFFPPDRDFLSGLFVIHYLCALGYFVCLAFRIDWQIFNFLSRKYRTHLSLLVILYNLSAFSLNQHIPIFRESADWLLLFLLVENLLLLGYAVLSRVPAWVNFAGALIFTAAALLHLYQLFMVLPVIHFGLLGIVFLGIGFHAFVPLYSFLLMLGYLLDFSHSGRLKFIIASALILVLSILSVHIVVWVNTEEKLKSIVYDRDGKYELQGLPDWVKASQLLSSGPLTKKYLMQGIKYQIKHDAFWLSRSGDRQSVHDPFVVIASLFSDSWLLPARSRVNILNFLEDARHDNAQRHWSGDDLETVDVQTDIEIFSEERLSFTRQTIIVANSHPNDRNQQEGFYTFSLPSGGVVSALSLWINGEEEEAILTTRSKAENAYNTIVGKEIRDPAVIYWMEGNHVRVRVFPCTPASPRKFSIGVTAPLRLENDKLWYESIQFRGPDYSSSLGIVRIHTDRLDILHSDLSFDQQKGKLSWQGHYRNEWSMAIGATKISPASFTFASRTYTLLPDPGIERIFRYDKVVIDLNAAFTEAEWVSIREAARGIDMFYTDETGKLIPVTSNEEFRGINPPLYSLFPFHLPVDYSRTLIITKSAQDTPNLKDLEQSVFHEKLFDFLSYTRELPVVYDLGTSSSTFLRSLDELGVISLTIGSSNNLIKQLSQRNLPVKEVRESMVPIGSAGIAISENSVGEAVRRASDHLMRLYFYNKILNEYGRTYYTENNKNQKEEELAQMAAAANIVTPVSSLIVLETVEDYERFEIENARDSLGNANINNSGAVPEPHEWMLIFAGLIFTILVFRRKLNFIFL